MIADTKVQLSYFKLSKKALLVYEHNELKNSHFFGEITIKASHKIPNQNIKAWSKAVQDLGFLALHEFQFMEIPARTPKLEVGKMKNIKNEKSKTISDVDFLFEYSH